MDDPVVVARCQTCGVERRGAGPSFRGELRADGWGLRRVSCCYPHVRMPRELRSTLNVCPLHIQASDR